VVEAGDQAVETQASLKALVVDGTTSKPLAGAKVALLSGGNSQSTDAQGIAVIKGVPVGTSHKLRTEIADYAIAINDVTVSNAGNVSGTFIAGETGTIVNLYPLTASLEGTAMHNGVLATSGTVQLVFASSIFEKTVYEATIGAGGKFVFEKLPAYSGSVKFLVLTGDNLYSAEASSVVALGSSSKSSVKLETKAKISFYVTSYSNELADATKPIEFNFSEAADIQSSGGANITDFNSFDQVWSEEGKKLTLTLFAGEKWPAQSFNVKLNVQAKDNSKIDVISGIISNGYNVIVKQADFAAVTGLKQRTGASAITADDELLSAYDIINRLTWDFSKDKNVSYNMYAKASKGSGKYVLIAQCTAPSSGSIPNCYQDYDLKALGVVGDEVPNTGKGVQYMDQVGGEYEVASNGSDYLYSVYSGYGEYESFYMNANAYGNDGYYYFFCRNDIYLTRYLTEPSCDYDDDGNGDGEYDYNPGLGTYFRNNSSSIIIVYGHCGTNTNCGDYNLGISTPFPKDKYGNNQNYYYYYGSYYYSGYTLKTGENDVKVRPFASAGKIEIVVQAAKGLERLPAVLSEAADGSKITLQAAP